MPDPLAQLRAILPPEFTIERPLSKGAQGAVFKGAFNGSTVAIKLFGQTTAERLKREVALLKKIVCPSLIKLVHATILRTVHGPIPLLAYEYVEGLDLRRKCSNGWQATEDELVALGCQVGLAVEALWSNRIVHRDIKPENIMYRDDGCFILVDLGLAQHLDLATITALGRQPGTPGYRSPEQILGRKKLTVNTDVFALGVTLYELAAGTHPWGGDETRMVSQAAPSLASVRPDLEPSLTQLIDDMLTKKPGLRPRRVGQRFEVLKNGGEE